MNQTVKQLWLEKLRDTQPENRGRDWMKKSGKYCPYGVLYELAAEQGVIRKDWGPAVMYDTNMHKSVEKWSGIAVGGPTTRLPSLVGNTINEAWDSGNYSWESIIDAIEKDM